VTCDQRPLNEKNKQEGDNDNFQLQTHTILKKENDTQSSKWLQELNSANLIAQRNSIDKREKPVGLVFFEF
jgi:hypothetical protein